MFGVPFFDADFGRVGGRDQVEVRWVLDAELPRICVEPNRKLDCGGPGE